MVEALREQSLAAVIPLGERYRDSLGRGPWVAAVAVTKVEKGGLG